MPDQKQNMKCMCSSHSQSFVRNVLSETVSSFQTGLKHGRMKDAVLRTHYSYLLGHAWLSVKINNFLTQFLL